MLKSIIAKLKGIYIGWDYDKYWNCREALFDPQINKLKFLYCKHYVSITNRKQNADIAYCIETGDKIFGAIHIGNNVRIGANCVVFEDVPDNATVVLPKPRVIIKDKDYKYYVASPTDWNSIGN